MILGENEFQGFEPINIDGIDVLEWTKREIIPPHKKITYICHTVANRPKKDEV